MKAIKRVSKEVTPRQKLLVQASFEQAMPRLSMVSDRFYHRLFRNRPELRERFPQDMTKQGALLTTTVAHAVRHIGHLEDIRDELQRLGQRHRAYGVHPEDYQLAGRVLISSIRITAGIEFSREMRSAWKAFYGELVGHMLSDT